MERCAPPIDQKFISSKPIINFPEKWLNPVVVLVDIAALKKNELNNNSKKSKNIENLKYNNLKNQKNKKREDSYETFNNQAFPAFIASQENLDLSRINPEEEYEVEKIVGHYRDKKKKMFYHVKWKNWAKEYNTYEPIENLTKCNYLLMKYFAKREQSPAEKLKMKILVSNHLKMNSFFQKLMKNDVSKKNLLEFSRNYLNIEELFKTEEELNSFEKYIKTELGYIMRCLVGMSDQRDEGMLKRAQNYKMCRILIKMRKRQLKALSEAEKAINLLENVSVKIENKHDFDRFPKFEYVVDLNLRDETLIPEAVIGCECLENCKSESDCCGPLAGSVFAYDLSGRLKNIEKIPIYECNKKCSCSSSCSNRVIQNGRKIELCIFKTDSYGWGVKTLEDIPKGTYVCQYLGELIWTSEINARATDCIENNFSYLFDLDFNPDRDSPVYTIDASRCGNLARFINHSCNPNLLVCPVWVDCLDLDMPRLAFFAKKDIKKYDEITFDYKNPPEDIAESISKMNHEADIQCLCKAPNCRQWIFSL